MLPFRFIQKPIITVFLLLLIHSVCGIPKPSQPLHNNEIIPGLTFREDDVSLASFTSSDWTYPDNVWPTLLQNNNIPAANAVFLGANTIAPLAENFDLVQGTPDAPTAEQQPRGTLKKGENGCPTMFPAAVCDPGEGKTVISKAALPGFLHLDKCRQNSPLIDPCRPPERLWCCASADTQDPVGIYGRSTSPFNQPEYNYQGLTCQLAENLPVA